MAGEKDGADRPLIGQNIRAVMARENLTPTQLAARVGAKTQQVNDWLNRHNALDLKTLLRISTGLKCSVEDVILGFDVSYDLMRSDQSGHTPDVPVPLQEGAPHVAPPTGLVSRQQELEQLRAAVRRIATELFSLCAGDELGREGEAPEETTAEASRSRRRAR